MDARKKRLTDAVDFHQFFTDADDVDNWMLDILKLVSSDDIGQDEGESNLKRSCYIFRHSGFSTRISVKGSQC
jgi:hypothetical protein